MDAFVKFLLDYYIWILAVLGIIIVTIIGFLVDSKQKRKKQLENLDNTIKNVETLPDGNVVDNVPVVDSVNQPVPNVVDNNYILNSNVSQPVQSNNDSTFNTQYSVGNSQTESSLGEQKPHFESREVNVPISQQTVNPNNYNQVVVPQPVNAVSINQPVQQSVYNQMPQSNVGYQNSFSVGNTAGLSGVVNVQQPVASVPISVQPMQNSSVGNISAVQPVYQNTESNSVQAQPVVQSSSVVSSQVPANTLSGTENGGQSVVYNDQNVPTTEQVNSGVGMNFVTGQQNVSTSEDMWKL